MNETRKGELRNIQTKKIIVGSVGRVSNARRNLQRRETPTARVGQAPVVNARAANLEVNQTPSRALSTGAPLSTDRAQEGSFPAKPSRSLSLPLHGHSSASLS
jgi:hypothetical protein